MHITSRSSQLVHSIEYYAFIVQQHKLRNDVYWPRLTGYYIVEPQSINSTQAIATGYCTIRKIHNEQLGATLKWLNFLTDTAVDKSDCTCHTWVYSRNKFTWLSYLHTFILSTTLKLVCNCLSVAGLVDYDKFIFLSLRHTSLTGGKSWHCMHGYPGPG